MLCIVKDKYLYPQCLNHFKMVFLIRTKKVKESNITLNNGNKFVYKYLIQLK